MVIRYLEILEAIAETGTFTKAAKKLYITQSAVSHAVAELEKQAGTALFERLPKGAVLTPCGVSLLEESRSILTACRNLDRRIAHLEENTPVNLVPALRSLLFCFRKYCVNGKPPFPKFGFLSGLQVQMRPWICCSGEMPIWHFGKALPRKGTFIQSAWARTGSALPARRSFLCLRKPSPWSSYAAIPYCFGNRAAPTGIP